MGTEGDARLGPSGAQLASAAGPASRAVAPRGAANGCRLCGGPVGLAFEASERMLGLGGKFRYVECEACASLQIEAIPASLEPYYAAGYYTATRSRSRRRPGFLIGLRRGWSRIRLRRGRLARLVSGRRYARFDWLRRTGTRLDDPILDVGCGSGRLLENLAHDGFTNLTGIDPRGPAESASREGLRFRREGPEEHIGRYRLVMAHHSFEHMRDPGRAFEAMAGLVEPGGTLLLRVPVADSWARRHYGPDWVQLDAPRHLHLPTRKAIEVLSRRAGLRVMHVVDDSGPFQIWGSELYRRGGSLSKRRDRPGRSAVSLWARLRARWQARRLSRAGLGDQACFYLRREGKARRDPGLRRDASN